MKSLLSTIISSATASRRSSWRRDLKVWQEQNGYPFSFYTEASVDLADRPELLAAMVEANFMYVFLGIETPSPEALKESKKFQNLRKDNAQQIRTIQESGLWVLGGFIVGFDSDDETIFDRQFEFITRTASLGPWRACCKHPDHRAFRSHEKGRPAVEESEATSNFSAPNFRTVLPLPVLLRARLSRLLAELYEPKSFFDRAFRSLQIWNRDRHNGLQTADDVQSAPARILHMDAGHPVELPEAYWQFLGKMVRHWSRNPAKLWLDRWCFYRPTIS